MTIIRIAQRTRWTVIATDMAQRKNMSFEARGMLVYLLSMPDDWNARMSDLENASPAGRDQTRRVFSELLNLGYATRQRIRMPSGKMDYESIIHEEPVTTDWKPVNGSTVHGKPVRLTSIKKQTTNKPKEKKQAGPALSVFLETWGELFPDKPQPRNLLSTTTGNKWVTRSKDKTFQLDWVKALTRASKSPTLQEESWFNANYFLRSDETWHKCLNGDFEWKDRNRRKNGNVTAGDFKDVIEHTLSPEEEDNINARRNARKADARSLYKARLEQRNINPERIEKLMETYDV